VVAVNETAGGRSIAAINRRDYDAALAGWAPEAVLDLTPVGMDLVEPSPKGREAIRKVWEEVAATFTDWEIELEESLYLGSGVLFTVYSQRGRPGGSSKLVEMRFAGVTQRETSLSSD
jgi:ketosteroid isomerase-like protein